VFVNSAVAASTAASYKKNFKTHILPLLGNCALNGVTHDRMVAELVKKERQFRQRKPIGAGTGAAGSPETEKPITLAKATIETVIKQLRKLFSHARKRTLIIESPATGLNHSTARRVLGTTSLSL
jgi:hypothetical protein